MYRVQQTDQSQWHLPSWEAAMDAGKPHCNENTEIAALEQYCSASNPTGSSIDNSIVCKRTASDNIKTQHAAAPSDNMWDPNPFAPQDIRSEVLDLFSVTASIDDEPAQQEISQSPPGCSEPTSTRDQTAGEQQDASALSRARTHPSTAKQKQANARESQRRFRLRQKVLMAPSCQLHASQLAPRRAVCQGFL